MLAGRFNGFLEMKSPPVIPLNRAKYLVLDEADRILPIPFHPHIKYPPPYPART